MQTQIVIDYGYGKGHMTIFLNAFFPCNQAQMKKLLLIVDKDWYRKEQIEDDILEFCEEKLKQQNEEKQQAAKGYSWARTRRAECEERIESKKSANGLPLTEEQLKDERSQLKDYIKSERAYTKSFNACKRCIERLEKNIISVKSWKCR